MTAASNNEALSSKPRWRTLRRWGFRAAVFLLVSLCAGWAAFETTLRNLPPLPLKAAGEVSVTVLDRNDRLLRAFTTKEGRWRLPVTNKDVDPRYLQMLLAFEDRRFWEHGGVDALALSRAAQQLAMNGRIVSGASTLTMQTARLLDATYERSVFVKVWQILRAVQLERQLT
ncbi:MAG: transglycosylase domain-containing protein, partial [Hyphomicrobiaceae bacterium]|nr:transglycosylase domain-containing protein [Hyphomicrobiaceae bacterium]